MQELSVTGVWMAGVVGMMLVFGIIAVIGVQRIDDDNDD